MHRPADPAQTALLTSLPAGSQITATFPDGSQPPYTATRIPGEDGGGSSGSYGLLGTRQWLNIATWGADLTVNYTPERNRLTDEQERQAIVTALYRATSDPDNFEVPHVANRLHALGARIVEPASAT